MIIAPWATSERPWPAAVRSTCSARSVSPALIRATACWPAERLVERLEGGLVGRVHRPAERHRQVEDAPGQQAIEGVRVVGGDAEPAGDRRPADGHRGGRALPRRRQRRSSTTSCRSWSPPARRSRRRCRSRCRAMPTNPDPPGGIDAAPAEPSGGITDRTNNRSIADFIVARPDDIRRQRLASPLYLQSAELAVSE